MGTIIQLSSARAKNAFLESQNYSNINLPPYFDFSNLLEALNIEMGDNTLANCSINGKNPKNYENVNYQIFGTKNNKYDWRKFELIHPVLYLLLVNTITDETNWKTLQDRFDIFARNEFLKCSSIPAISGSSKPDTAEQISKWWQGIEQKSIELSLDFQNICFADIANFYPSIYTHSIDWAIRGKENAKLGRGDSSVGVQIDSLLRAMNYGQTNGIAQGSMLMDFLSEILLGYTDLLLAEKLREKDFNNRNLQILRYRDDYRIFTHNREDGGKVIRILTEILLDLGLRLNSSKTQSSNNIITSSLKDDKTYWLEIGGDLVLQNSSHTEKIRFLHSFSLKHPNSGTLVRKLTELYQGIESLAKIPGKKTIMTALIVDIALNNPKTFPICTAILGKILSLMDNKRNKICLIKKIQKKMSLIPNTGLFEIWFQRIFIKETSAEIAYSEKMCQLDYYGNNILWESDWLANKYKMMISEQSIVNQEIIDAMPPIIEAKEISPFIY